MKEELREVLTCASVEGEDFTAQVIAHLHQLSELGMLNNLENPRARLSLYSGEGNKRM